MEMMNDQILAEIETKSPGDSATGSPLLRRITARFASLPISFGLTTQDGKSYLCGSGRPEFWVRLKDKRALLALASIDEGKIAAAYLDGAITIEGDWLRALDLRQYFSDFHPLNSVWRYLHPLLFGQIRTNAKAIHTHYDFDADFYQAFQDPKTRCYTQGVFLRDDESLEDATVRKLDFCFDACKLKPGDHVLEVGPGWGAFSSYAARKGIRITGVMNSTKSKEFMDDLGRQLNVPWEMVLADIFQFLTNERFDAIVLMGIMEHLPDYGRVLRKFQELLKPGGYVYLDASATRVKFELSSFISRYIYQGNHSFFILHDFLTQVAKTPFRLRGVHDDQHSYFLTFRHWAQNFEANRERIIEKYGAFHYRRFHLYLWGSAHSFLTDILQCYRVVLELPQSAAA
jgi:cyclopropane-fatty-acyl-phospholipid synthase